MKVDQAQVIALLDEAKGRISNARRCLRKGMDPLEWLPLLYGVISDFEQRLPSKKQWAIEKLSTDEAKSR